MAASDYITVAQVRDFIQKPGADTQQDAIISALITRACRAVMSECEREFAPVTTGNNTMRTFEAELGEHGAWVDLAPYDLRTVASSGIKIDTDQTSPVTLSADEYRLWPRPNPDGTFLAIRVLPLSRALGRVTYKDVQVQVTGDWGFATVPDDVIHWTIVTVAVWLRRDVSAFSTTFNITEDKVDRPEALPSAVRGGLALYRRVSLF